MSRVTNSLVGKAKHFILPGAVAAVTALGTALFVSQSGVHASAVTASPLDDNSVSALTSLDQAVESVAARVTPAVERVKKSQHCRSSPRKGV